MFTIWVIFHVIICVALVLVVLLQSAKGEGLAGSAFGGGGGMTGAVFGGRGAASFLSKATTVLAIIFMFNCGALAFMSSSNRATTSSTDTAGESVVTREAQKEREQAMQMQQQQQQQAADSASAGDMDIKIIDQSTSSKSDTGAAAKPDTSGK